MVVFWGVEIRVLEQRFLHGQWEYPHAVQSDVTVSSEDVLRYALESLIRLKRKDETEARKMLRTIKQ
jgi:hypothetical protein